MATKLRQIHLLDVYHVGEQRINTLRQKVLYLMLSMFFGFLVWLGTDVVFSPTVQDYFSSPLKWMAFPILATVLAYTLCLPAIAKNKYKKMDEIVSAVNDEMREKGVEIVVGVIKKSN